MTLPMGSPNESVPDNVRQGLARLFRLRLCLWGTWLAFIPLVFLATAVDPPDWLVMSLAFLWLGSWLVLTFVHILYRCPACRHLFNLKFPYRDLYDLEPDDALRCRRKWR